MVKSFSRESDDGDIPDAEILAFCEKMRDKALMSEERLVNCVVSASSFTVSKLFITKARELDQCYSWVNMTSYLILRDGEKMAETYGGSYGHLWSIAMADFPAVLDSLIVKVGKLAKAKPITPGVYDVITDPSISGLIAHEAFGHGVEMDQFVKDRALAKDYVGKQVASPICNMRDGAASALSTASYFFDDDGAAFKRLFHLRLKLVDDFTEGRSVLFGQIFHPRHHDFEFRLELEFKFVQTSTRFRLFHLR